MLAEFLLAKTMGALAVLGLTRYQEWQRQTRKRRGCTGLRPDHICHGRGECFDDLNYLLDRLIEQQGGKTEGFQNAFKPMTIPGYSNEAFMQMTAYWTDFISAVSAAGAVAQVDESVGNGTTEVGGGLQPGS